MADILQTFERLVLASQSGTFLSYFRSGAFESIRTLRHPLGFRVARLMSEDTSSLRLHIWPSHRIVEQPGYEIHDHNFRLKSHVLLGKFQQTVYNVCPSINPEYNVYKVNYDDFGSILIKSGERVLASIRERSFIQAGDTYQLSDGIFHKLDLVSSGCAASLVLTTQAKGIPKAIGPLDGPEIIRFDRTRDLAFVTEELARCFGEAATK